MTYSPNDIQPGGSQYEAIAAYLERTAVTCTPFHDWAMWADEEEVQERIANLMLARDRGVNLSDYVQSQGLDADDIRREDYE